MKAQQSSAGTMQGNREVGPHQVNARRGTRLLALGQLRGQDHGLGRSGSGRASWFRAVPGQCRPRTGYSQAGPGREGQGRTRQRMTRVPGGTGSGHIRTVPGQCSIMPGQVGRDLHTVHAKLVNSLVLKCENVLTYSTLTDIT